MTSASPMTESSHAHAAKRSRPASRWTRLRVHPAGPVAIMFFGLLAACIIAGLLVPTQFAFLSQANLTLLLRAIPSYGIVTSVSGS